MPDRFFLARRIARVTLVSLALLQAWVFRHTVSPDGVSYLDLSDAVVTGGFRDLVNGYWSPLYPIAIGATRLIVTPTPLSAPYWEFAIVHVVNVVAFVLALMAFEWFVRTVQAASAAWAQPALTSALALALAYGLFGAAMLVMVSVSGTGPDLLLAAAIFASFACIVRLQLEPTDRKTAIKLGIVMAAGALTKSIMFPLAAIMLIALAIMTLRRARRASLLAATVFVVVTVPWCFALSSALGRPTTGETGALNWAWYVNHQQPPNTGVMPRLAQIRDTTLPLDGVAILRDARGTNPVWYDPARWHRDVRPRFELRQLGIRIATNAVYFLGILAPLVLVAVSLAAACRLRDLQTTLTRSFVVLVPSLAAVGAYAMTYATARYIAPFLVAIALILAAAFPREASLRRDRLVLAAGLMLLLIDALSPLRGRVLVAYAVVVFAVAWAVWNGERGAVRRRLLFTAISAGLALWALMELPSNVVRVLTLGMGVAGWYWFARREVTFQSVPRASPGVRVLVIAGVVGFLVTTVLTGGHAVLRLDGDAHPHWTAARRVIDAGVPEGSTIAVFGNPENPGWARLARYRIVGVIPDAQTEAFLRLTPVDRERLMTAFEEVGATRLIRARP